MGMLKSMDGQWEVLNQLYVYDHERGALLAEEQAIREQLREVDVVATLADERRTLARQLKTSANVSVT